MCIRDRVTLSETIQVNESLDVIRCQLVKLGGCTAQLHNYRRILYLGGGEPLTHISGLDTADRKALFNNRFNIDSDSGFIPIIQERSPIRQLQGNLLCHSFIGP